MTAERDVLKCENGKVTYRFRDSETRRMMLRTVGGATFIWLVLRSKVSWSGRRIVCAEFIAHQHRMQVIHPASHPATSLGSRATNRQVVCALGKVSGRVSSRLSRDTSALICTLA